MTPQDTLRTGIGALVSGIIVAILIMNILPENRPLDCTSYDNTPFKNVPFGCLKQMPEFQEIMESN